HQFWRERHGVQPAEPLLRDTGTLDCRDAVLAWDAIRHDPSRDRPDPTPRLVHPVTGVLVPEAKARRPYYEEVGVRATEWQEADFNWGNPPYVGGARRGTALGEAYVDALRAAYVMLPEGDDYGMFWCAHAARAVAHGTTIHASL